jgi:hypothetical protein
MRDKKLKHEEIEASLTLVAAGEGRIPGRGNVRYGRAVIK